MPYQSLRLICLASLGALAAAGQGIIGSWSMQGNGDTYTVRFNGPRFLGQAVTGAPYTADQVQEHTQTLADGTHITQTNSKQHVSRDSQGRTRIERPLFTPMFGQDPGGPMLIEIQDPVEGAGYILDEQNRVAHRVKLAPTAALKVHPAAQPPAPVPTPPRPQPSKPESLGTQTIEGVLAEGTRRSTTWPVGSVGNDRPITDSNETWYSQELKLMVLSKSTSLRNGDNVMKLINISRAEPDPALFQPPPGFTVVDEQDSFQMTLKRQ